MVRAGRGRRNSFPSESLFQRSILSSQVIDRFRLLSVDPSDEYGEEPLPWREYEIHVDRQCVEGRKRSTWSSGIANGLQLLVTAVGLFVLSSTAHQFG